MVDHLEIIMNEKKGTNHLTKLIKMAKKSDELVITSPFLAEDLSFFLEKILTIRKIRLITVLTGFQEGAQKVLSLRNLFDFCKDKKIDIDVYTNEYLHGKAYLFYKNGKENGMLISSANLTGNGMKNHIEWGVVSYDIEQQKEMYNWIFSLTLGEIRYEEIVKAEKKAKEYLEKEKENLQKKFDARKYMKVYLTQISNQNKCYLKLIGVTGDPFVEGMTLKNISYIGFTEPFKKAKAGDIFILHSVGTGFVVGCYELLRAEYEERMEDKNDRWKYKYEIRCLTQEFSEKWWDFKLSSNKLVEEFLEIYPEKHITFVGGNTLGAIKWGRQKICLTNDFAEFILKKIEESK